VRFDALEPCVHDAHLLAHLEQQAEQLGHRLVLGRAAVRRARALELWRHLLIESDGGGNPLDAGLDGHQIQTDGRSLADEADAHPPAPPSPTDAHPSAQERRGQQRQQRWRLRQHCHASCGQSH
jgi:hypothetical protein